MKAALVCPALGSPAVTRLIARYTPESNGRPRFQVKRLTDDFAKSWLNRKLCWPCRCRAACCSASPPLGWQRVNSIAVIESSVAGGGLNSRHAIRPKTIFVESWSDSTDTSRGEQVRLSMNAWNTQMGALRRRVRAREGETGRKRRGVSLTCAMATTKEDSVVERVCN